MTLEAMLRPLDFILCEVGCHGRVLSQAVTQSDLSLKGPLCYIEDQLQRDRGEIKKASLGDCVIIPETDVVAWPRIRAVEMVRCDQVRLWIYFEVGANRICQ